MTTPFISQFTPPAQLEAPALWFIYYQDHLLCPLPEIINITELSLNLEQEIISQHYLGLWQQKHCFCAELKSAQNIPHLNLSWQPLRQAALQLLSPALFQIASRALQILQWDKNHQFCSRCGAQLQPSATERAKVCSDCHLSHYPRISPCVIILVKRDKEILLARSPHFLPGIYSTPAGFMEPGETAEQAVQRELQEETGIQVKNIIYRFSQAWPFSESLMLGFTAEYLTGDLMIDNTEIEDAGWFTRDNLPRLPSPISIASQLIELFMQQKF